MRSNSDNPTDNDESVYDRVNQVSKRKNIARRKEIAENKYYFVKDRVYWKDSVAPTLFKE